MRVLGLSFWYHDAAACLIEDGRIVAAAQEERFSRKKHDERFPAQAVRYCLAEGQTTSVDAVAFYDKPILKLQRILETTLAAAPRGVQPFVTSFRSWMGEKIWVEPEIVSQLRRLGLTNTPPIFFPEHHLSHAASAFYPSPFDEAAVLTLDGVGEWSTSSIGDGSGARLELIASMDFPHSLGMLYSAFTHIAGFKVNSGEYKLMGLAPYGEPRYVQQILDHLIDLKEDGSFRLNMEYFGFVDELQMTNERFARLFDGPRREPEARITRREVDLARSIQEVTERIVIRMARHIRTLTSRASLCLSGGVALNCVANGRLLRERIFDDMWIQPAAGDAGSALGAAFAAYHQALGGTRERREGRDAMHGSYLGPAFSDDQIREFLDARGYPYEDLGDDDAWAATLATLLADEKVVGLFQGRMEFGPRSLGNRAILGDPRSPAMQSVMNLKIKQRESFRPFAPAVLEERSRDYFDLDHASPYMLLVAPLRPERRRDAAPMTGDDLLARVNQVRSDLPAITHVDYSARVQTVNRETNPRFHRLLEAFEARTGCAVLVNTSFNVRGEPIVCTPEDAYRCFMGTEMDALALGRYLLRAERQPGYRDRSRYAQRFEAD